MQESSSLEETDYDEGEEEDSSEDEPYDPDTYLERLADKAYNKFLKNQDEEVFQACLRSTKEYTDLGIGISL